MNLPAYEDLPLNEGDPKGSAWGLWGKDNQLGTLNLLTEETVANAAKLVKKGKRISLNLELSSPVKPLLGRRILEHKIWQKVPRFVNDDEIFLNTQCSSQIDGLRHYAFQEEKLYYGGVTEEEIMEPNSTTLGMHKMSRAGIAGRGVLIDHARWAEQTGKLVNPATAYAITLSELLEAAKSQGITEFQKGDILIVRSGYVRSLSKMTADSMEKYADNGNPYAIGVQQSEEMLAFLWNNHFAMVAGDALAFERRPPLEGDIRMHGVIIAGWGMPMGELWDLEELSEYCAQQKQYTFFLTSAPLNVVGGVGTTANALAVF